MAEINIHGSLEVQQTIEMLLSPRMLQMLKMLNMSYIDMVESINQKSEENVMLEIERPDRLFEYMKQVHTERISRKDLPNEDLPGIEGVSDSSIDLPTHLRKQLALEEVTDIQRDIVDALIGSIDERGYFKDFNRTVEEIKKELGVERSAIEDSLSIIHGFEPEGVGARDLKECLLIQVKEYNFDTPELEEIITKAITDHLEELGEKKFDKIAKALKIPLSGVEHIADFIKNNLNPNPGYKFADSSPCVIPSFMVKKVEDKYVAVNLEKKYGPVLKVNQQYEAIMNDPKTDKESFTFLKSQLAEAKEFLENIEKRNSTIEKIVDRIVSTQSSFFEGGEIDLNSLMQKDIANELGLHPSTISRAISNKYLQTPNGVVALKFLCPRDVKGLTSDRIEKMIGEIIKKEDKNSPLTDKQISEKLTELGTTLKRRTITAYRKKLGKMNSENRVKS